MFLQIHTLTSYHASLLNRDDAGLAKRIPFGDQIRLRISSQCLKRHWREALHGMVDLPGGLRTRHFFEREVCHRLITESHVAEAEAIRLTETLIGLLLQKSDKPKADKPKKGKKTQPADAELELDLGPAEDSGEPGGEISGLQVKQPILFGRPEADFLVELLAECAAQGADGPKALAARLTSGKANFNAMLRQAGHGNLFAGVEGALFGRFVTSDILARSDAAVHVAHAFTVHGLNTEVDFFTVVDDLHKDEETGAAHAGDMELGAGVFYGYVAVDVPLLVSNFTGCDPKDWCDQDSTEVRQVLTALVRAIATVSPGAKLGATAPYAYSDFVLLESGTQQPRALANAYLKALRPSGDVTQQAVSALATTLAAQEAMYGATANHRALATTCAWSGEPQRQPLDQAVSAILNTTFGEGPHGHPAPAL
jgi:CRISPR system Cascade subunit CasC